MTSEPLAEIAGLIARMDALVAELAAEGDAGRHFLATYTRTTRAVADALDDGRFEDPAWVEAWDVVFADLYLDALSDHRRDRASAPRPWRIAFEADPALHPARARPARDQRAHQLRPAAGAHRRGPPTRPSTTRRCWSGAVATTSGSTACSPSGWPPRTAS